MQHLNTLTERPHKPVAQKTHKRSGRLNDAPGPNSGIAAILAQSGRVATGFGPYLGFVIIMTAAVAGVSASSLVILATGIGRLI
jgi:hypothetical protein